MKTRLFRPLSIDHLILNQILELDYLRDYIKYTGYNIMLFNYFFFKHQDILHGWFEKNTNTDCSL